MHSLVQQKIDELKQMFKPEDTYKDRLGKLAVIESELYADVAVHSNGVLNAAVQIAESLNMSDDQIKALSFAVRWHDIGKLAVPDEIFRKPGSFNDEEYTIMKQHARAGLELVGPDAPEVLKNVILYHHEQYCGRGYERLQVKIFRSKHAFAKLLIFMMHFQAAEITKTIFLRKRFFR